ncbi:MAG: hypothetical protein LBS51_01935, partial [Oscillospiraceae bacterium]|nr:hypothetical protein [Oscillospiraceae bacterium]
AQSKKPDFLYIFLSIHNAHKPLPSKTLWACFCSFAVKVKLYIARETLPRKIFPRKNISAGAGGGREDDVAYRYLAVPRFSEYTVAAESAEQGERLNA